MRIIIGFIAAPMIGSGVITPMTGLLVEKTCEMARLMSYSSNFSRSSGRNGRAAFCGSRLTARPR